MPVEQQSAPARTTVDESQGQVDQLRLRARMRQMEADQNVVVGAVVGLVAAAAGAIVWALVTYATGYQIGWMAVGVGFLVGYAVRLAGKGVTPTFGIVGALLATFGCLAGDVLTVCLFVAQQEAMALTDVLASLTPALVTALLVETFSPIDLLFYGIAIYVAYQYSFNRVTEEDLTVPQ